MLNYVGLFQKVLIILRKKENAEGRSRTDMGLLPLDFESSAYTNFATPAREFKIIKLFPAERQPTMLELVFG